MPINKLSDIIRIVKACSAESHKKYIYLPAEAETANYLSLAFSQIVSTSSSKYGIFDLNTSF